MKTVTYTTLNQTVMKEWLDLWKRSDTANYTNSPQWFLSTLETFSIKKFVIIAIYQDDKLIAVGGLIKEKKYGISVYTVAPNDFACGFPFLFAGTDELVFTTFTKALLELGTVFLSNFPETFIRNLDVDVIKNATEQTINYYLPLQKDKEDHAIIVKRRKMLREIRGIEDKFTMRSFTGKENTGLDIVFSLDEQSRKQGRGYNTFASADIKKFYLRLAENFNEHFCVNILYFQTIPIAYEIGFKVGEYYFGSQIAYVSEYRNYSPGKVLLINLLDSLVLQETKMMDFGSGDSTMKAAFTEEKRKLYYVIISKNKSIISYLKSLITLKDFGFTHLHNHTRIYSLYKNIRKQSS